MRHLNRFKYAYYFGNMLTIFDLLQFCFCLLTFHVICGIIKPMSLLAIINLKGKYKMKRFDCKDLFNQALVKGITLFCGAGFSIYSYDKDNEALPLGNTLLDELKKRYNYVKDYSKLSNACTKITKNDKSSFYSFMNDRFSVSSYKDIYDCIKGINIKSIFTTNIDDLFFKIYESDTKKKLHNMMEGSDYGNDFAINYYPLHGCVRVPNCEFVFGTIELASAFSCSENRRSWRNLAKDASKNPILFWGWNFEDPGPIQAMYGTNNDFDKNIQKWMLLYDTAATAENIDYLEELGFNIIIGDTDEMLTYIQEQSTVISELFYKKISETSKKQLNTYSLPKNDDNLTKYSIQKYYQEYTPLWSHIYSKAIPKTRYFTQLMDSIASKDDVFITGIKCSGKTTLLMQVAYELNSELDAQRTIHYMVAPSLADIETYIQLIDGAQTLLFVDNCFRDTNAVCKILEAKNIQGILVDRDFNYERQYHKISCYNAKLVDVTELKQSDAQKIIEAIPKDIKRQYVNMKNVMRDPTILNLMVNTIKPTDFGFIKQFINQDKEAAKVFLAVCYVHSCGVPCSFDMLYSFLGDDLYSWKEMYAIIERVGGLIKTLTDDNISFYHDQDYFTCRSRVLAEKIISSIPKGDPFFREVLEDFTRYVPQYKICQYDKFRRSAYDAQIAQIAYDDDLVAGEEFYNLCSGKDDSEYIYQQAALFFSKAKEFTLSFYWIDKAKNFAHYNRFSIDSTYAQIYFDANIESKAKAQLEEALSILYTCCRSDKRRNIHIVSFIKRAIKFHHIANNTCSLDYIKKAQEIVDEALNIDNKSLCQKNRWEIEHLKKELDTCAK